MRPWVACVVALAAGCYEPPHPDCGFICGPHAACPTGYACEKTDNRCHRLDSDAGCEGLQDAFVQLDAPPGLGAPEVTTRVPGPSAFDVPLNTTVEVSFSENVVGVTDSTFTLELNGVQLPASVTYDAFSFHASLFPQQPLDVQTTYAVTLESLITDIDGNHLQAQTWFFTTGRTSVPPF